MKRILVVRNDKIGDFMLAWPCFAMLKQSLPCHLTVLVPAYTAPLAKLCPWIDQVIIDPGKQADKNAQRGLLTRVRAASFDASICLFSNARNALLVWKAKIPYRLAPATKIAQVLYNQRLLQRRSRSEKPEFEYNLDLIRRFLTDHAIKPSEPNAPYFSLPAHDIAATRARLTHALELDSAAPWLIVHAGSSRATHQLSVAQLASTIIRFNQLYPALQCILTAGPGEEALAETVAAEVLAHGGNSWIYSSQDGLASFCQVLANAAIVMAGQSGPLHIAAALDVPTIGFFPQHHSATPLRWQPLNRTGRHIAFSPPADSDHPEDMAQLDPEVMAPHMAQWVKQLLG
ncbi:MAG: glycosyltransferase family 9 protein [Aeromonas sp.]